MAGPSWMNELPENGAAFFAIFEPVNQTPFVCIAFNEQCNFHEWINNAHPFRIVVEISQKKWGKNKVDCIERNGSYATLLLYESGSTWRRGTYFSLILRTTGSAWEYNGKFDGPKEFGRACCCVQCSSRMYLSEVVHLHQRVPCEMFFVMFSLTLRSGAEQHRAHTRQYAD